MERVQCADVGQNLHEEINLITSGGNYGWNWRGSAYRFDIRKDDPPEGRKFIDPAHEYVHQDGISITGGMVYRGKAVPELQDAYIYGDGSFGTMWALRVDDSGNAVANTVLRAPSPGQSFQPVVIAEDAGQELLVLSRNCDVFRPAPAGG